MTLQESTDLQLLKEQINKEKINCFDHCIHITRLREEELQHTGHKSIEAGLLYTVRATDKTIKILTAAYLEKYPDK